MPTAEEASQIFLKSKQDQLGYLIASTLRIEKGLATMTQNQESLERIIEQQFYALDVKVTEIQTTVEKLQEDVEEKKGKSTTDAFARVPRGQRSAAMPVPDTRATSSASATTLVPPAPAPTPPAPSTDAFVLGVISTPPHEDQARDSFSTMHFFVNFLITCCQRGRKMYRSQASRESVYFLFSLALVVELYLLV